MFSFGWILLITVLLAGCEAQMRHVQNPSPTWTVENPNASTGESSGQTVAAHTKDPISTSSLDALRTGESTMTPASSPLKDVYFAFDSHELTVDAREVLKTNANWLKAHASARIQIEGHCDERGTVEYNLALGARRAKTVKDHLVTLGVTLDRISDISYGEEIPICKEQAEGCWEKNRRARFVIVAGRPTS
jgi:peptidoglycan-associated lipoprotein